MGLEEIVNVNITTASAGISQAGFGTPLILGHGAQLGIDRVRSYSTLKALGLDFASTTPEYLAAQKIFSQSPRPKTVMVGRANGAVPIQKIEISVASVVSLQKYSFRAGSVNAEFTSDGTATNDEIITGLKAAFDALAIAGFTSSTPGAGGSTILQILANAGGNFLAVESKDLRLLATAQTHADPGLAAELDSIANVDDTWYALITLFNSKALVQGAAAWAESNQKLYLAQTIDSPVATLSSGSDTTTVAYALKNSAYARSGVIFNTALDAFSDAAWLGRCLPLAPGSETWKFKTLAAVPASPLSDTHITNLKAKNANFYRSLGGVNITAEGKVAVGEYIDVIRFRDWLVARMQERIFGALVNSNKIPFTDRGISLIAGEVRAQLIEGVKAGGLADSPKPTVSVPKAADVSTNDKAARTLNNVAFTATLAGAIHNLTIDGTISA